MQQLNLRCCGVVVACAALASACGDAKTAAPAATPPRAIQVLTLAPTPLRTTGEYLGSLLSRGSVSVLPQVAGYIREIHVRPGLRVAAGAALVEIDARDENAALSSASAQVESAEAQRALAQQMLSRAEALNKEGLATAQEIDQRRADLAAATAAVRTAGAQVSQRRVALSNRTIRAAIPGVIGDIPVRIGDYVTATTPLTAIAGADALELSIWVPAARARALTVDAPVEVLAEDDSVLVSSKASFIAPEADPRTQLVEVKATFDNKVGLRPRELVRARIVYSTEAALQVPLLAVQRQAGRAFAFVVVDKHGSLVVERRVIQIGALREHGYLVKGNLAVGDRIAVSSLQVLRDGAAVTIQTPAAESRSPAGSGSAKSPAGSGSAKPAAASTGAAGSGSGN
jgi:RND family efflux transporter MFP subunit